MEVKFKKCRVCLRKPIGTEVFDMILSDDKLTRMFIKCFKIRTLHKFMYEKEKVVICDSCKDRVIEMYHIRYMVRKFDSGYFTDEKDD